MSFVFSEDVSGLTVSNLVVREVTSPAPCGPATFALSYDSTTFTATWTFPGLAGRSLPDGNYIATLLANTLTDSAGHQLDGVRGLESLVMRALKAVGLIQR